MMPNGLLKRKMLDKVKDPCGPFFANGGVFHGQYCLELTMLRNLAKGKGNGSQHETCGNPSVSGRRVPEISF